MRTGSRERREESERKERRGEMREETEERDGEWGGGSNAARWAPGVGVAPATAPPARCPQPDRLSAGTRGQPQGQSDASFPRKQVCSPYVCPGAPHPAWPAWKRSGTGATAPVQPGQGGPGPRTGPPMLLLHADPGQCISRCTRSTCIFRTGDPKPRELEPSDLGAWVTGDSWGDPCGP